LGNVQLHGGTGNLPHIGDGDEIADLAERRIIHFSDETYLFLRTDTVIFIVALFIYRVDLI
jgi:hypothetical protein